MIIIYCCMYTQKINEKEYIVNQDYLTRDEMINMFNDLIKKVMEPDSNITSLQFKYNKINLMKIDEKTNKVTIEERKFINILEKINQLAIEYKSFLKL